MRTLENVDEEGENEDVVDEHEHGNRGTHLPDCDVGERGGNGATEGDHHIEHVQARSLGISRAQRMHGGGEQPLGLGGEKDTHEAHERSQRVDPSPLLVKHADCEQSGNHGSSEGERSRITNGDLCVKA